MVSACLAWTGRRSLKMDFNDLTFPLLIPSFSSKGNLFIRNDKEGTYTSDNYSLLEELGVRVSKCYLISAYDIYYGFMPTNPEALPYTEFLFVDSGGYEISDGYDLSERNKFNYKVMPWDIDKMLSVYSSIMSCDNFENSTVVLTSYDSFCPVKEQITKAIDQQNAFPDATIDFLIKFPPKTNFNDLIKDLKDNIEMMNSIHIVGISEKDLGNTISLRLKNLITFKELLYAGGWDGYIHVFGGLEPTLSQLYYLFGADIVDGLSWQKFRYSNNTTLYDSFNYFINLNEYENKMLMIYENLSFLANMSLDLSFLSEARMKLPSILMAYDTDGELTAGELLERVKGVIK